MTLTTIMERARPVGHTAMQPVGSFAVKSRGSVDPARYPEEVFELFSIPAYDLRTPEVLRGAEIGSAKKVVAPGDVLISRIVPHIQRVWVVGPSNGHRQIASGEWIVFGHSEIDPNYLRHMLLSKPFHDKFMQTVAGMGGSLLRARPSEVERIEIPVPSSRTEQRRIAAILDKADAIRRKREQAITLADDFLRSVFMEMFGEPNTNRLGLNKVPLGDMIRVSSGNGLIGKNMAADGIYPVYGGNGVNGYHSEYMFEEPQIVIGRVGAYCGAVHVSAPKSWVTDNALYIRTYKQPINKTYLEWALRFANLNQYAGRAAQPLISGGRIYEVEILVPDDPDQLAFHRIVQRHSIMVSKLKSLAVYSGDLFAALSQRAFAGDL